MSTNPASGAPAVRHGRQRRSSVARGVLALIGIAVCVALVASVSVVSIWAWSLGSKVSSNAVDIGGKGGKSVPSIGAYPGAFNLLLVGVDNDPNQSAAQYGPRGGATLNDVNILLHVSADHRTATAVSIPRDMVVPLPSCTSEDGKRTTAPAVGLPINVAYSYGGLKCVADTVSKLSGLDIPFAGVVSFNGVVALSNAVGGVDVCVTAPINDRRSGLVLPAGTSTIQGQQALAFVRSRYSVGDGSDLGRISSQQVFLSSLVRKLKSAGTLGNPGTLFQIANVATSNMKLSTSLASPITMVSVAQAMKDISLDKITFVQYPGTTGGSGIYAGKVQPTTSVGNKLFAALKADKPFALDEDSVGANGGSALSPSATSPPAPAPTGSATPDPGATGDAPATISGLKGQTAAQQTCTVANR